MIKSGVQSHKNQKNQIPNLIIKIDNSPDFK